jgi:hypothetical protein
MYLGVLGFWGAIRNCFLDVLRSVTYCCHQIVFVSRFFFWNFFLEFFFALTTSCRFARAYRSRTNLITKHSSLDLFYQ